MEQEIHELHDRICKLENVVRMLALFIENGTIADVYSSVESKLK